MINIIELTIHEAIKLLDAGTLTSLELTQMYMERIAKYNKNNIGLNAILELNPDAIHIAEAMDYERRYNGKRSMMHGIPILLKDNINTGDKMHTSAGSLVFANSYAPEDAHLVKQLRASGAIILGKTNMTEFANYFAEDMPPGYSSRGGAVLNPYNVTLSPSGSSSGSAVAVSANLCMVAVGTETNGSILSPAMSNCIVGIKPTVGLISRNGIIPISNSQDTAGPMARTVADAAILLDSMVGVDENDPATWKSKWKSYQEYSTFINQDMVRGLHVGIYMVGVDKRTDEEKSLINEAISVLSSHGVEIVNIVQEYEGLNFKGSSVCLHEFKMGINYYLNTLSDKSKIRCLEDIIVFNQKNHEKCLKYGQKILELSEQTNGNLTEEKYISDRLKDMQNARVNGIDKVIDELKLDALIFIGNTSVAAISGYPAVLVPAGLSDNGKTHAFTFVGKAFSEGILISLAYTYEQDTKKRIPPILEK